MKKILFMMVAIAALTLVSCKKEYTITVNSNNSAYGTVTGGGSYEKGSTATITANPHDGYIFAKWQDGNTTNPRSFEVTGDATYTATFEVEPAYADAFVGEYTVEGSGTLNNIPVIGTYTLDIPATDATIAKVGNSNAVELTMAGQTVSGYVDASGLHVDPIVINQTIATFNVSINVSFPTIVPPLNGQMSWVSTLSASLSGVPITGTADLVATKK